MSIIYNETQPFNYGNFFAVAPHDVDGDGKLDIVWGKRNLSQTLPNYLMWLGNESPAQQPAMLILHQNVTCDDNGTPANDTDDVRVLKMRINNPAQPDGQFFLTNPFQSIPLDTAFYNQWAFFRWHPGSAGDGIDRLKEIHDLQNPSIFTNIYANAIPSCSFESPATISLFTEGYGCDANSTIDDGSDDVVKFYFHPQLNNVPQVSPGFFITSNAGAVQSDAPLPPNQGRYGVANSFRLPPGSANAVPQVILTIKDMTDTSIVKQWIFDNPCYNVSTGDFSGNTIFSVAPNPVPKQQALRVLLENDFSGTLTFEFVGLDGQVLQTLQQEKSARQQYFEFGDLPAVHQFFLRVSDGKTSVSRLVFKPE